jgi:hypothetical protein
MSMWVKFIPIRIGLSSAETLNFEKIKKHRGLLKVLRNFKGRFEIRNFKTQKWVSMF